MCEAELAGLIVDQHRKSDILGGKPPYVAPDPSTKNQHESLHGAWWIAEFWPKVIHVETPQGMWQKALRLNLGRRRWIAPGLLVHESVEQRFADAALQYKPSNLPQARGAISDRCVT